MPDANDNFWGEQILRYRRAQAMADERSSRSHSAPGLAGPAIRHLVQKSPRQESQKSVPLASHRTLCACGTPGPGICPAGRPLGSGHSIHHGPKPGAVPATGANFLQELPVKLIQTQGLGFRG